MSNSLCKISVLMIKQHLSFAIYSGQTHSTRIRTEARNNQNSQGRVAADTHNREGLTNRPF